MLKKIILILLFSLFYMQYGKADCFVIMPSELELEGLFKKWGLEHFARTTGIIKDWANLKMYPEALEESKYIWLTRYQELTQDPAYEVMKIQIELAFRQTESNLNKLIDELLLDNPKAQKQLEVFRRKISGKIDTPPKKRRSTCLIC